MRKRTYVIGALAASLAVVGVGSGVATGARTVDQLTRSDICPVANTPCTKPIRTKKRQFKKARLHTLLAARDSADPESCRTTAQTAGGCIVPPAADNVKVDFDNDIKFSPNAVGKCAPATIAGDSTATARSQCAAGLVGTGTAFARFGTVGTPAAVGDVPTTLSAFNSTTANQIIFHVDPGFAPFDLFGNLIDAPGADYGKRLNTDVVTPGTILVRFDIFVGRAGYIKARCKDRNKTLNFKYLFHYGDVGTAPNNYPATTAKSSVDKCKRIRPRRRR